LSVYSRCLSNFPQFEKDFEALWRNKIITGGKNKFKWNYNPTSLGQYFHGLDRQWSDYFWEIVEFEFGIKRHTLKHLVSPNGREPDFIREKAIDYEKLLALLEPHRKQVEEQKMKENNDETADDMEEIICEAVYKVIKIFFFFYKPEKIEELNNFVKELNKLIKEYESLKITQVGVSELKEYLSFIDKKSYIISNTPF
jgi:hypothetical protein